MPISDTPDRSRRRMIAQALAGTLAGAAALTLGPAAARADAASRAADFVAGLSAELIGLLRSGLSEAQLYVAFERLLARYADVPVVAASALGPPWRSASAAQKQAFVAAFQTYLARKYGKQFRDYQNAQITVVRARDAGRNGVLVETKVSRPGRDGFTVEWQVSERGGQPKVINLIIEGVAMLTNERAEVGAMLEASGGSIDKLTARMRATG
jgi:phospholipid transport system substrate-binding protein